VRKFVLAVVVLALCTLSFASNVSAARDNNQQQLAAAAAQKRTAEAMPHSPFATSICSFTFTTGSGSTFLKYCVTANGNITQLETPQGHEHIAVGDVSEGYGICDLGSNTEYFDYADDGDSGNWGPASVMSQSATSVKIARTTTDGVWTLTQTISQVTGTAPFVKITMALKNNTNIDRTAQLMRFADVDADSQFLNGLGATSESAFAWDQTIFDIMGYAGLMLQGVTHLQHSPDSGPIGFTLDTSGGPSPCNPHQNEAHGVQTNTDGSVVILYGLGAPKHESSPTVTFNYRGL
jgi:hypothetical protein